MNPTTTQDRNHRRKAQWHLKLSLRLCYPDGRNDDLHKRATDLEWRIAQAHAWLLVQTRHAQAAEVVQLRPGMFTRRQAG